MNKMWGKLFILLPLFSILCAGCSKKTDIGITDVTAIDDNGSFSCNYNDIERKFLLYVPDSAGEGAPLLFMLHGYGNSIEGFELNTGMNNTADEYGYVVVYAEGLRDPGDKTSGACWNSGLKDTGNDDTGYLVALAKYLQNTYGYSKEHTFAAGFSNGALMMYRLACKAPDTFRAVASVCGTMTGGAWNERSEKTSVGILQINGTKDSFVPLDSSSSTHYGDAPAIDGVIEYWKTANDLDKEETIKLSDKTTAYCYSSDKNDNLVWHLEIEEGGHSWPTESSAGIKTNEVILNYFNHYIPEAADTTKPDEVADLPSLKEIYKDDFLVGTIYAENSLTDQDIALMDSQFNVITPENIMKPEGMQNVEGTFTYDTSDKMIAFAKEHNLLVAGHTLAWHQQSPVWMAKDVTREKAIEQLKSHITNVAGHYKGDVISWDVVNEAIEDNRPLPKDGDWTKCLRHSPWYNAIGPDYIALAFQFAKEANPDCKLYYNDYNLETPQKADVAYAMIKDLISQGVPIEGVGIQGHYQTGTAIGGLDYAIQQFGNLDVEISVTELDVTYSKTVDGKMPEEGYIEQAITYAQIFKVLKANQDKIARVTFWGTIDSQSWRGEMFPCMFDSNYKPKEAFYAVVDPEGYLEKHADKVGVSSLVEGEASYGTPLIDGKEDEIWSSAKEMPINRQVMAWQGATGMVKALWDENHLYALIHVKDNDLNTSSANPYEHDSIEIFVDQNNGKSASYQDDDGQYRVDCKGKMTFGTVPTKEGVESVAVEESGGYLVEIVIPFTSPMKENTIIGFDAQINDAKNGARIGISKFCDSTDNSYLSTEYFGNLKLCK